MQQLKHLLQQIRRQPQPNAANRPVDEHPNFWMY